MFFILLILFVAVPLTELSILTWLSREHGLPTTIAIVFATGVLGAALARWQGLSTIRKIQQRMASGQAPTSEVFDGALILVAGAVLLTPGLLTDAFGFSLLVPQIRRLIGKGLAAWFKRSVKVQTFNTTNGSGFSFGGSMGSGSSNAPGGGTVIDAEFTRLDNDEPASDSGEKNIP